MEITEKEGWSQIKDLIDKAGQLIKFTGIKFDIDLEIVKNEITDDIIYTICKDNISKTIKNWT